jgi:hypothetical protein
MARVSSASDRPARARRFTPARAYCVVAGLALLVGGALGFTVNDSFTLAEPLGDGLLPPSGDELLGFEVNGWHNVVHLASGVVLLLGALSGGAARAVALTFGLVYGAVTVVGIVQDGEVLGILPINTADTILHIGLSVLGIVAALLSGRRR